MDEIGISRTIRIMPHDQDTGGFYLALFRKKSPLLWTRPQYSEQILGTEKYQQV
jgi:multisite-specific tRNA:(cytosine-C5)-methyltransferase/tRNA (cytosine34-C5)-methyltransferase